MSAALVDRHLRGPLAFATRIPPLFRVGKLARLTPAQAQGIRYERKVGVALTALAKGIGAKLEHNPWFRYTDATGTRSCSPDYLLVLDDLALVVEVKNTWVPTAEPKLRNLYIPVVSHVLRPIQCGAVIICKNLVADAPAPTLALADAFRLSTPVYHWSSGPLHWS